MQWTDILIIVFAVLAVIVAALYFLNKWASKKNNEQQSVIEKTKQSTTIFVIDKKRDKAQNVTLPKAITDNLPKMAKTMKMNFVKAKVGPQIVTLMSDKRIYSMIETQKSYKVELAGIYIVSVKGMKTAHEMKEAAKEKSVKEKALKKEKKDK